MAACNKLTDRRRLASVTDLACMAAPIPTRENLTSDQQDQWLQAKQAASCKPVRLLGAPSLHDAAGLDGDGSSKEKDG
jgi:hypothetical protein